MNTDYNLTYETTVVSSLQCRLDSQYKILQRCANHTDHMKSVLDLLEILSSKSRTDTMMQKLDPKNRYYFELKFQKVHDIAVKMYSRIREQYPDSDSGIFGVSMILADAMIQMG